MIKRLLPKSLFGRSLLILLLPLILLQVVMGYIFFDRHTETILRLLSSNIAGDVQLIADMVNSGGDLEAIQKRADKYLELKINYFPKHKLASDAKDSTSSEWLLGFMESAFEKTVEFPHVIQITDAMISLSLQLSKGVLEIDLSKKRLFSRTTPLVIIWTTLSALLLFMVASVFMRNQIKPLKNLAEAVDQFGKGHDMGYLPLKGASEIRKTALAFNVMRERLKRYMRERMDMLACVSHDLRTPLTRMGLQIALLKKSQAKENLSKDMNEMKKMIEEFLLFSKTSEVEPSEKTDIVSFLENILTSYSDSFSEIKTLFNAKKIDVLVKPMLLKRCLENLLNNAQRFASKIMVFTDHKPYGLEIILDDNGPGIPQDSYEDIFKPFFRLDESRNAETGGVGLGMTIARDAIMAHGGTIRLDQSPLGGLRVVLRLPY